MMVLLRLRFQGPCSFQAHNLESYMYCTAYTELQYILAGVHVSYETYHDDLALAPKMFHYPLCHVLPINRLPSSTITI
jgi:hypothetical protein